MDKAQQLVGVQYSELKDNLGEIEQFYAQYNEQGEKREERRGRERGRGGEKLGGVWTRAREAHT